MQSLDITPHQKLSVDELKLQIQEAVSKPAERYNADTVMKINALMAKLAVPKLGPQILKDREERRKIRTTDQAKYIEYCLKEGKDIEETTTSLYETILKEAKGDYEKFMESSNYLLMENLDYQLFFFKFIEEMRAQAIVQARGEQPKLTRKQIVEQMQYYIQAGKTIKFDKKLDAEVEMFLKRCTFQDLCFEKFGFEEEQAAPVLAELKDDAELMSLAMTFQSQLQAEQDQLLSEQQEHHKTTL